VDAADTDGRSTLGSAGGPYSSTTAAAGSKHASVDVADANWQGGRTPLNIAAAAGHTEMVQVLLAAPNLSSQVLASALHAAANAGHTDTAHLLLAASNLSSQIMARAARAAAAAGHAELAANVLHKATVAQDRPAPAAAAASAVLAHQSVAAAVLGLLGGCRRCDHRRDSIWRPELQQLMIGMAGIQQQLQQA
jgi:hypothetical protein